ncbi:MAG: PSD1 and planctomycete cytochrome C domain-containing protein [Planctomycetia bacterium]|nr:PSD1 and planctomycete cytochrome C domain-containing protein [Planctomycetia bacterium]
MPHSFPPAPLAIRRLFGSVLCLFAHGLLTLSLFIVACCCASGFAAAPNEQAAPQKAAGLNAFEPAKVEFFEKRIRPILVDNCYNCHSADTNSRGGLRVDDRNGLINGGEHGAAIVPGRPEESLLLKAVSYTDPKLQMPPKKQLTAEQVADLRKWIGDGAAWPGVDEEAATTTDTPEDYERLRRKHWAWQPLKSPAVPNVRDTAWPRDDLDRFILVGLEAAKLAPVADAERLVLIRRLSFDLTGLPPTPSDIDLFTADASPDAVAKLVDRLLASPAFGERWGRHWLDVARYAESTGPSRNIPYPHAWRYRDYVIDAVNDDKPYDLFIREQIAGDLLLAATPAERDEKLIATGFLALGVKDVNQRFKVRFTMDNIDEQIDTVTRSVLALTASCARCHDHKYDPIPATDYYALAGIFHSTDQCAGVRNKMGGSGLDYYDTKMLLTLSAPQTAEEAEQRSAAMATRARKIAELKLRVAEAKAELKQLVDLHDKSKRQAGEKDKLADQKKKNKEQKKEPAGGDENLKNARQKTNKLQAELAALEDPALDKSIALGVREAVQVGDTQLRIRGEAEKLGPVIPRGFLTTVSFAGAPKIEPRTSGRLELAHWLTAPQNPLTSRVMVNRVWRHLFGRGIVSSVDNFGTTGDTPSHPELLDHLAGRFVRNGWSVKKLVRAIVLSRAYQLSAATTPAHLLADPANRLIWRHAPRRLEAEEIRDATLAAAGKLDLKRPHASPARDFQMVELANNGGLAKDITAAAQASVHRSVYLPLLRDVTPTSLEVFDFAQQGMVTGSRDVTTVASQALYSLNDPFVRRQAGTMAEGLLAESSYDDAARIRAAYRTAVGRAPTDAETARGLRFVAEYETSLKNAARPATKQVAAQQAAMKPKQPQVVAVSPGPPPSGSSPKPAANPDPDAVVPVEADRSDKPLPTLDPRTTAWAAFCQALIGSAEFRYVR